MPSILDIDQLLPQTQCEECGYPGCRPYAQAIHQGKVDIAQCAPGGLDTLYALAQLTNQPAAPHVDYVQARYRPPATIAIDETRCIGCTKCIQACPVDAILGSGKWMHSVLTDECTGCGLCIEPCPVDCIELKPLPQARYDRKQAEDRYQARQLRLAKLARHKTIKKPSKASIQSLLANIKQTPANNTSTPSQTESNPPSSSNKQDKPADE